MDMDNSCWAKPLTVRLQNGLARTFHSVDEAIDFMENEWPTRLGVHHRRALNLCRSAERFISRETAREAFIAACFEARMPLVMEVNQRCQAAPHATPSI